MEAVETFEIKGDTKGKQNSTRNGVGNSELTTRLSKKVKLRLFVRREFKD